MLAHTAPITLASRARTARPSRARTTPRATTTTTRRLAPSRLEGARETKSHGCVFMTPVSRTRAAMGANDGANARRVAMRAAADADGVMGAKFDDARGGAGASAGARGGAAEGILEMWARVRPTIELGVLFASWYYFSIAFNVYQKAILKAVPMPLTVTFCELAVGSALAGACWLVGLKSKPVMKMNMLKPLAVLGGVHMLGNALTNVSLGKVAVSFTHTIKALEPVFSVGLSAAFMGVVPSLALVATLVPIIGGVAIASATEVSFNMPGFIAAMGSNLTFQSRNVLSKKMMGGSEIKKLDYTDLLSLITIMAMIASLPLALAFESSMMNMPTITAGGMPLGVLGKNIFMASLCFQLYQAFSFLVLERVTPVTHSVGNSLKRVFVIACSVIIFRNPVSMTNIAGTALAIFGVFMYGAVKRSENSANDKAA